MKFSDLEKAEQERLLRELYGICRKFLRKWDIEESAREDILQVSLFLVTEKFDTLRNPEKLHSWAKAIVTNEAKRYMKERRRERELWSRLGSLREFRCCQTAGDWFAGMGQDEAEAVWNRMEELSDRQIYDLVCSLGYPASAILLRAALYDESFEEIGRVLHMKAATVRSHVRRGRIRLKKMILEDRELAQRYGRYFQERKE